MNPLSALSAASMGQILLFASIGSLAGVVHFVLLRANARLFVTGGALRWAISLQLLRLVITSLVLFFCALAGAQSLLAALGGLLLARQMVVRKEAKS